MLPENMSLFNMYDLSKKNKKQQSSISTKAFFSWNRRVTQGLRGNSSLPTKNKRERKMKLHVQIYSEQ